MLGYPPHRQKVSLEQKHHLQQTVKQMREENSGLQSIVKRQRETLRKQASRQEKIAHAIQLLDRGNNSANVGSISRPLSASVTLEVLEGGASVDDKNEVGGEQGVESDEQQGNANKLKYLPRPASASALVRNIGSPMQEGNAEGRIVHNAMAALMQKRAEDAREITRLTSKINAMKATVHMQERDIKKMQSRLDQTEQQLQESLRESKKKVQTARSTVIGDLFKQGRLDSVPRFQARRKSLLPHTFAMESEASATLSKATANAVPSKEHKRRQSKLGELSAFRVLVNDEVHAQNIEGMVDVCLSIFLFCSGQEIT